MRKGGHPHRHHNARTAAVMEGHNGVGFNGLAGFVDDDARETQVAQVGNGTAVQRATHNLVCTNRAQTLDALCAHTETLVCYDTNERSWINLCTPICK